MFRTLSLRQLSHFGHHKLLVELVKVVLQQSYWQSFKPSLEAVLYLSVHHFTMRCLHVNFVWSEPTLAVAACLVMCNVWCAFLWFMNLFSSRNHTAWCDFTAWASFPIKASSMWYKQDQRMPFVMLYWIKNNASSLILWTASADPRQSRMPMTSLLRKNCMLILVLLVYINSNAVCTQNQFKLGPKAKQDPLLLWFS